MLRTTWNNRLNLVVYIAQVLEPDVYLELGVDRCRTINKVATFAKRAIGVDISDCDEGLYIGHRSEKVEFYKSSTDDFFRKCLKLDLKVDLLFIDADHRYEQTKKDFDNYSRIVIDNGIIILHDSYINNESQSKHFISGTVWKLARDIRREDSYRKNFEIFTIPQSPGYSMIRKTTRQLSWRSDDD